MSNVNLPLDEIIKRTKAQKRGRGGDSSFKSDSLESLAKGGRRRSGGGQMRRSGGGGAFSKRAPEGRWSHDMYGAERQAASSRGAILTSSKPVRINLTNLAPTVVTSDLEELFEPYNIETATVHYTEAGESLGTGDLFLKKKDALRVIQDFKGIAVDGYKLGMVLVDGNTVGRLSSGGGIASRVQFGSSLSGGIRKRSSKPLGSFGRSGGRGRGGSGRGSGREGGKRQKKKPMTEEELDMELDAYMKK